MAKNAKYIKNTLGKGEEIKWVANLHWFVWVIPTLCLLFGILTLIAGVGLFFIFIFLFYFIFRDRVSVCSSGTQCVEQVGLTLRDLPASTS